MTPRWIVFHLLVIGGCVAMLSAARWQLERLDARQDFNAIVEDRTADPPSPLAEVLTRDGDLEWTPVILRGRWLPENQVFIVNRSQGGVAGRNIVTPVLTDDGRVVAVTRGFLALSAPVPELDTGDVTIAGLLRTSETRGFAQARDPEEGRLSELQRLDLDRLARQLPPEFADALVPWSVSLERSDPAQPPTLVPIPRPELSEGPHLSYAIQWLLFTLCAMIGWGFAMSRSIRTARRRATAPAVPPSPEFVSTAPEPD